LVILVKGVGSHYLRVGSWGAISEGRPHLTTGAILSAI